ncbi:MAG: argininosuccinate synthase [Candidatus Syntrophonatronum acetioxidans]|uniref:Argininosuccinate synthase n=1 Tax=Candidatus Syntrophonatronum acetioxidans TaxID=1795816 RepID=A0A424YHN2_9FIRM|nr:MAG: argininosuccinate synthase [Candidatus Syntrophonatronum acetioxidans]
MKVVLAYSGGLDTSIIIKWLKENYNCEVIAVTADLGQEEELDNLEAKALETGASKLYIENLQEEFVKDYIFPTLKAGAIYEKKYLLGTAMGRPLIAKRMVEIAEKEGAEAIAHGCTGKGNDQVRFELAVKALNPKLKIIAPWREWNIISREEAIDYAKRHNIPISVTKEKPFSIDRNLWHISYEGGALEDISWEPDEDMFLLTNSPAKAPDEPLYLEIFFEKGVPQNIDGKEYPPVELLRKLNKLAGLHGVGRVDLVENRLVGMKSRGIYETPGGTVLFGAHQELESITLDRETMHFKEIAASQYARILYYGQWFAPLRKALDAFVENTQEKVTGTVRVKLFKGNCFVVGRKSDYSLYREDLATFEKGELYDHKDAGGFINCFGLPLMVQGFLERKSKGDL